MKISSETELLEIEKKAVFDETKNNYINEARKIIIFEIMREIKDNNITTISQSEILKEFLLDNEKNNILVKDSFLNLGK